MKTGSYGVPLQAEMVLIEYMQHFYYITQFCEKYKQANVNI
ncbi:hypothetical protein T4D_6949 [Trichinella pseudospiralis]|uniref:Uncharacterized protein n=1 Tax=Trichinella pseudospiralis TaxID=6337 RepID=A0A0V1F2F9_TRIPS|nr:hypothetical protein T4D_6949 [Trichinella pseudospiralis]